MSILEISSVAMQSAMPQQGNGSAQSLVEMLKIEETICQAFASEQKKLQATIVGCRGVTMLSTQCWRERVAQWCYDIIDHLGEGRELVYVAMNILDRFTNFRPIDERCYEVEAMSALLLAVHVGGSGALTMHQMLSMSREGIRKDDLIVTGKLMISVLNWNHRFLTPADFVHVLVGDISFLLHDCARISLLELSMYLVELAVFDLVLSTKRPSLVAAAATRSAVHLLDVIKAERKVEVCRRLDATTARFGDVAFLQHRFGLIFHETPGDPHLIMDEDDD